MRQLIATTLSFLLSLGGIVQAEDRRPSVEELRRLAETASETRTASRQKLERFFSSEPARRALKQAKIDSGQVMQAIATLDQEDLDRLAARADKAERDFAAGALSNLHLTYIVIALAAALFVLIIVVAAD